jgi:hypothetical protein
MPPGKRIDRFGRRCRRDGGDGHAGSLPPCSIHWSSVVNLDDLVALNFNPDYPGVSARTAAISR